MPNAYSGTITLHEHSDFIACGGFRYYEDIGVNATLSFKREAIPSFPPNEDNQVIKYHSVGEAKLSASKNARYNGTFPGCSFPNVCTIDSASNVKVNRKYTELKYVPAYGRYEIEVTAGEEASETERCPGGSESRSYLVSSMGAEGVAKSALAIYGDRKEQPPHQPGEHHWVKTVWNFQSQ